MMVPELRTPGATSAAKPPFVAVMVPMLTIEASGRPGIWKLKRPAMKSSLRMSLVVARKPAVLITAPAPKMMPSRLTTNTLPLASRLPRICDGPEPAGDAVERDRVAVRLNERGALAGADVEHVPVDDGLVAELIDGDVGGARVLDRRAAADHGAAVRARAARRSRERHQGRGDQQEIAEALHPVLRQCFAPRMRKTRQSSRGPSTAFATERSACRCLPTRRARRRRPTCRAASAACRAPGRCCRPAPWSA